MYIPSVRRTIYLIISKFTIKLSGINLFLQNVSSIFCMIFFIRLKQKAITMQKYERVFFQTKTIFDCFVTTLKKTLFNCFPAAAPRAVHLEFDGRRVTPSTTPVAPSASSSKVTYREKDNVSIQCVVEGGNPPPKVYWYVGNMNMTNNSQIRSEYLEDDKIYITRSSLLIGNISRTDHNKSIVCIVDHELLNQQMVADISGSARGSIDAGNSNNNMLQDSAPMSMPLSSNLLRAMARFNVECKLQKYLKP